jgi:hypothetical protein
VLSLSGALGLIIAQLGSAWTAAEGGVGIEPLPFSRSMTMSMSERVDPALIADRLFRALHHIEPSFSPWHIAAVLVMLAVVYPLAIAGAIRTRGQPLSSLMVAVVLGHLAIIAITFMDRDGRYLLYFFPLVVVFAAEAAVAYGRPRVRRFIA